MKKIFGIVYMNKSLIIIFFMLFFTALSVASCSEWDFLRRSLAEASMSSNTSWMYARFIDQEGNDVANTKVVVQLTKTTFIPTFRMTFYEDLFPIDSKGILKISPRGDLARILRLDDDRYAPISYGPFALRGGNKIDDPSLQEQILKYNGLPDKPITLRVWRKQGPIICNRFSTELENKHSNEFLFCFDPFTGTQLKLEEVPSATHAIILREIRDDVIKYNAITNVRDYWKQKPKYVYSPNGFSWYVLDRKMASNNEERVYGVFRDRLCHKPIVQSSNCQTFVVLKSDSSSMSALLIMAPHWSARDINQFTTSLQIYIAVNPNGTSLEAFPEDRITDTEGSDGYTWKGCKSRDEYMKIDPSFPKKEVVPMKLLSPILDPTSKVPPEWLVKPKRYILSTYNGPRFVDEDAKPPKPPEKPKE